MSQITVSPSQTRFTDQENETVLAAALRNGINLPHSCQSGVCGCCAAKLVAGSIIQCGEYDDYVLTEEERAAGMILLCCSQANGDVEIDMPAYAGSKAISVRTLPARIGKIDVRGSVALLTVALPKAPPFQFHAGQYMEILLRDGRRCYSIANPPSCNGSLEFHVRLHEGGLFSPQLFDGSLKPGDIMRLRGPLGAFTLNENSSKPLILLATGTGLAPVKSLLAHLADTDPKRSIECYYGTRTAADLYDESAIAALIGRLPNARYTPVLSRADADWQGARGYITEHVLAGHDNLANHEVYACGSPEMIRSAQAALCKIGLPTHAFYSDAFTASL